MLLPRLPAFLQALCGLSWPLHLLVRHTPAIQLQVSVTGAGIHWLSWHYVLYDREHGIIPTMPFDHRYGNN